MDKILETIWHRILRRPYNLVVGEVGKGEPLVLLHGLGANQQAWEPLIEQIDTKKQRAVTVDLLGFGESPQPDWSPYDTQEHAKSVVAALKKLKLKNVTLVGHSMGCLIAARVAAKHPRLVKKIVLYEPPLFVDTPEFRAHMRRRDQYFAFFEYIAKRPKWALLENRLLKQFLKRFGGTFFNQSNWLPFERSLRNTIMNQQTYHELQQIKMPTHIIHGRLDFMVIRTQLKQMFKSNPHIKMHTVTQMHGITKASAKYILRLL